MAVDGDIATAIEAAERVQKSILLGQSGMFQTT
jgi:hypothetical protein